MYQLSEDAMKYPIGIQDFEKIRTDGYAYVDKTAHVYNLAHQGSYYFLSRPRRFGKSLLLSTLKAYFLGKKNLFKGLAIEALEKEWIEYPVLYLDINSGKFIDEGELSALLRVHLARWEESYGKSEEETTLASRFAGVIRRAYQKTGRKVVVLVDEYDKPMLETIDMEELQNEHRATLKAFYSVLKTCDAYIQFAFLTGVTKFGKVSVFSDLNNLKDISMDERYTDICGLTEKEIHDNFDVQVGELAVKNDLTKGQAYEELRRMYDGYHFEHDTVGIYNPFSLLNALDDRKFSRCWFASGTPTFLINLLKNSEFDLRNVTRDSVPVETLNGIDNVHKNPIGVIYQSGYLTISGYDKDFGTYFLDYPNAEVKKGFLDYLLPAFTPTRFDQGAFYIRNFVLSLRNGKPEEFLSLLTDFFDSGDYQVAGKAELYFQNAMYVLIKLMGFYTDVEVATSRGRIDLTIQVKDYIYLIELKLDGSASEALAQIEQKGYARKFASDERKLYKIGINFSSETRGIAEYEIG